MKSFTRLLVLCLAVTVVATSQLFAVTSASNAGVSAVPFLKIAQGARPAGMGEAFTAVADDANAAFWNPAGLALVRNTRITGMYDAYFQSIYFGMLGSAIKSEKLKGTLGAGLAYLDAGGSPTADIDGNELGGQTVASDMLIALSYARKMGKISAGFGLKIINSTLGASGKKADGSTQEKYSPTTFALDLGVLYRPQASKLSLGLAIQNAGGSIKYISKSETLPLMVKLGIAYKLNLSGEKHKLMPSLDLVPVADGGMKINFGTEYTFNQSDTMKFAGRVGYKGIGSVDNTALGGMAGISFGAGVEYSNYVFDFSFVPYGVLGNTFRVAFGYNFGK